MDIRKPIAIAAAVAAAVSAFTACDKKNKMTASVPIIVTEPKDMTILLRPFGIFHMIL